LRRCGRQRWTLAFRADEFQRLLAVFPEGICDWSKPDPNH